MSPKKNTVHTNETSGYHSSLKRLSIVLRPFTTPITSNHRVRRPLITTMKNRGKEMGVLGTKNVHTLTGINVYACKNTMCRLAKLDWAASTIDDCTNGVLCSIDCMEAGYDKTRR